MNTNSEKDIYIALVHYPVLNKKGDVICSAVTNLDIHDIARAGRTYGVKGYYIITTLTDQKELVSKITSHWTEGHGGTVNPDRKEALSIVSLVESISDAVDNIQAIENKSVTVVATTAKKQLSDTTFDELKTEMINGGPCLLLFGTAWGLSDAVLSDSDKILMPIRFDSDYNHLSVRSAVAIVLDRLMSER